MLLLQKQPDTLTKALQVSKQQQVPMVQAEMHVFGFSHAHVGGLLAQRWKLSRDLQVAGQNLGQASDRAPHPARLLVGGQREGTALAALPAFQQRARQEREPTGLVGDLADHRLGQPWLQAKPCQAGG